MRRTIGWIGMGLCGWSLAAAAQQKANGAPSTSPARAVIESIVDQGMNHSEIPETAEYLFDQIGGRLTNSPAMRRAQRWTQDKLKGWGLKDVRTEGFDFGRGWWIESSYVRMLTPRPLELKAIPVAWTPPTQGVLRGSIIVVPIGSDRDFADWKGKLAGKIVLATWPAPEKDDTEPVFKRLSDADIAKLDKFEEPTFDPEALKKRAARFRLRAVQLDEFLSQEGAVALVTMSRSEGRLVHGEGYAYRVGAHGKASGDRIGRRGLSAARPARQGRRRATRDGEPGALRGRRSQCVQRHSRHSRRRSERGLRHGRRAPRQLGRGRRRRRQRRRDRHGHGGGTHPGGARRAPQAHHSIRTLGGRGAGAPRIVRLRREAPRASAAVERSGRGGPACLFRRGQHVSGSAAAGLCRPGRILQHR